MPRLLPPLDGDQGGEGQFHRRQVGNFRADADSLQMTFFPLRPSKLLSDVARLRPRPTRPSSNKPPGDDLVMVSTACRVVTSVQEI